MKYKKQVEALVDYFKKGEKKTSEFKIGVELEHFIIWKDSLKSVSYFEHYGIKKLLEDLVHLGWKPEREKSHIIKLKKEKASISLEPGGQLEFDVSPQRCLGSIESIYLDFLEDIIPLLEKRNQAIIAIGYQPRSLIAELPLLPKKRYEYMYTYFKKRGKLAHNMMKGTASTQVCVDYGSEEDFIRKSRVAAFLTPIIYCVLDNAPFFEGEICKTNCIRKKIWDSCDDDRCGLPDKIFSDEYSYESYAEYILTKPPIIVLKDNNLVYTGSTPLIEIFDPETFSSHEIDHILSMFFFDIRVRSYLELRMGDSLPYPFNIAYAALWKGLVYNIKNLSILYEEAKRFNIKDMKQLSEEIMEKGVYTNLKGKKIIDYFRDITAMAKNGLDSCEKNYLSPIEEMLKMGLTPKNITLNNLQKGRAESLKWCCLDGTKIIKRCDGIACC